MKRAVIDTNVFVAATRSADGASFLLWSLVGMGRVKPVLSVPLFTEYEDAAKREGKVLSDNDIDRLLNDICSAAELREIHYLWRPFLKDPGDDHVLEAAIAARCMVIVTFNKKDFSGVEKFGISVYTPQEFLRKIGEIK
ncbi:MAG: putative toxin-antitoxin system toxin component, PIN family [Coriobacteriales bacterium]|nr:putative toxin-antitoxin system toxin component, PIN family [Coriobacteriales bacterium]